MGILELHDLLTVEDLKADDLPHDLCWFVFFFGVTTCQKKEKKKMKKRKNKKVMREEA